MVADSTLALVVMGALLLVIVFRGFSLTLLELMMASRSGSTVVLLLAVLGLFYKNLFYSGLAFSVLAVYLLKDLWTKYPVSDARRLLQETTRDKIRFDPAHSIDLQFANGSAKHDSPSMYGTPQSTPLLIFPPTEDVLHSMCG